VKEWVGEERAGQMLSDFSFMGGKGVGFYFRSELHGLDSRPLDQSAGVSSFIIDCRSGLNA